ncbi:MAG: hypothetical protein COY49_12375 [Comamonadaceae bacterium CG_4_10_14_0_8_um_filter_57_29]|nr:MAG: hypothetical protein AUK51_02685 [Comamonadaceae bacterium CG2_30_59_20]PIZ21712.1 MAG: hypothetical protein COY49_12375 [Comamonadaceae bacterium CG_4_10_14_0_8_um_filter_57_29]
MGELHFEEIGLLGQMKIEVIDTEGFKFDASVFPAVLSECLVTGVIQWRCTPPIGSIVRVDGKGLNPGCQYLALAWGATLGTDAPELVFLQANRWALARLSLPKVLGRTSQMVHVTLSALDAMANIDFDNEPEQRRSQPIAPHLLSSTVGLALSEMSSQLLLRLSWQAVLSANELKAEIFPLG